MAAAVQPPLGVAGMCQLKRQHLQRAGAGQQTGQPAVDKAGIGKLGDDPSGGRQFSGQRCTWPPR